MRQKRQLNGKIIKTTTIRMRASVRDKVDSFTPPGGSFVNTLEQMVEYLYARRQRRREKQHNRENS